MIKFIFILIILLSQSVWANIFIENIDNSNYPNIKADFFYFGKNNINEELLFLYEQGSEVKIENFQKTDDNSKNLKGYLVIDISNSMAKYNETTKKILTNFINEISINDSLGIIFYNQTSYQALSPTNQKDILLQKVNTLNYYGSSNIDELFFNSPFSLDKLVSPENEIIIITDKEGFGSYNSISNFIKDKEIRMNIINLSDRNLENLKNITNGFFLDRKYFNDNNEILSSYLLFKLKNKPYYSLNWITSECSENVKGNIVYAPLYSYEFKYENDKFKDSIFEIVPSYISIDDLEVQKDYTFQFILKSNYIDIDIQSIESSNPLFITSNVKTKINKGDEFNLKVDFKTNLYKYYSTVITINTNCDKYYIPIEIGPYSSLDKNSRLMFTNGSKFFRGDTVDFLINDLTKNDTLKIEYKSNGIWNIIDENISTNNFSWKIPDLIPQPISFRLSYKNYKYTQYDKKEFELFGSNPKKIHLNDDLSHCVFWGIDNRIYSFNMSDPSSGGIVASAISNCKDIAISKNKENISVINNDGIIIFDIKGENIPIQLEKNESLLCLDFNIENNSIFAGDNIGNILKYPISDNSTYENEIKVFSDSINDININPNKKILTAISKNSLVMLEYLSNGFKNIANKEFETIINNFEYSSNGDTLFVSTQNEIYKFLITKINTNFELVELEKIQNINKSFGSYGFESGLIFTKNANKIFINSNNIFKLDSIQLSNYINYLKKNILLLNDNNNKLIYYNLNNFKTDNYENSIIQNEQIDIIPKFLNFKNIELNDICINNSIDTLLTSYLYNSNDKEIVLDSIVNSNKTSKLNFRINNFLSSKSIYDASVSLIPQKEGVYDDSLTIYSGYDTYSFKINYNIIRDEIEQKTNYLDFGNVLVGDSLILNFEMFNSSNSNIKINILEIENNTEEITVSIIDSILNNDNLKFKFSPNQNGIFSEKIRIKSESSCTPFEFVLFGKGVSPSIKLPNEINLDTLFCKDQYNYSFEMENKGDGLLIIEEHYTNNIDFLTNISNSITKPNEKLRIDFIINPSINNLLYQDTIYLKIRGFTDNNINLLKIPVNYFVFISNLETIDTLDFGISSLNIKTTKNLIITNNGFLDEMISISSIDKNNYFKVINGTNLIESNDSKTFQVEFNGGNEFIIYEERFVIKGNCENPDTILFKIDLRGNEPILLADKYINLDSIFCEIAVLDTNFSIKNTGVKDLVISKIYFDGLDKDYFTILNENDIEIIKSNQEIILNVRFSPIESRFYKSYLIIQSNSSLNDGVDTIEFVGNYLKSNISSSKNIINHINYDSNIELRDTLVLFNLSEYDEIISIENTNDKIQLSIFQANKIKSKDSIKVELYFEGGFPDEIIIDTLNIISRCNINKIPIFISLKGTNYFVLSSENILGKIGDTINIPIYFNNPEDLVLELPFVLETELLVDKNVIQIEGNFYLDDEKSVLPITFQINSLDEHKIDDIKGLITLGNMNYSILSFRNSKIKDNSNYYFKIQESKLEIEDFCIEGEERLIDGNNRFALSIPYPNPSNNYINISYNTIEDSMTKLYITDSKGIIIDVLLNESKESHSNTILYNCNLLPPGTYSIILETKNNYITRRFVVVR